MPAPTRKTILAEKHIEAALIDMPEYVIEYVRSKENDRYSPKTLSGYLHDYKRFFDWLRDDGYTTAKSNKDIPYSVLAELRKREIEYFFGMLSREKIKKSKDVEIRRSEQSVNRFIQSLKSLFNYLTTETEIENEDDDRKGECYFDRNVMAKIKTPKKTESTARRAKRISSSIFDSEEMDGFLEFIRIEYIKDLSPRQKSRFERDRLRDIAIVSLFQGSGIRVDELAGLLLTDIDFHNGDITALRKGSKLDTISITNTALKDLKAYTDEREDLYGPDKKNQFVFLTKYRGVANAISVETVQKLINKYSQAFLSGKRLSPHKLRHSFSKKWLDEGGSLIGLRDQLGHNTIETTTLYTNFSQDEQREHLDKMDKSKSTLASESEKVVNNT